MEAPKCPECNQPLTLIRIEHGNHYFSWNETEGVYEPDDAQLIIIYICGNCGKAIGGTRADGESWGFIPQTE